MGGMAGRGVVMAVGGVAGGDGPGAGRGLAGVGD